MGARDTRPHRPRWLIGLGLGLVVVVALGVLLGRGPSPSPWPENIRIATATKGGTYNVLGSGLAVVLASDPERRIFGAVAERSNGSGANIDRLVRGDTELALVSGPVLGIAPPEVRDRIRSLARLYDGYMQLVVRTDAGIERLADLEGKRIYIGKRNSGTEAIALGILEAAGFGADDWRRAAAEDGFSEAALRLAREDGDIDAAIFGGGIPTAAVRSALRSGACRLLGVGEVGNAVCGRIEGLGVETVPEGFYRGQQEAIETIVAPALLVARRDLPDDLVEHVLDLLFDNVDDLLAYALHQPGRPGVVAIEAIGVQNAFPASGGPYHPGSLAFQARERERLLIATGALGGRYHQIGLQMQMLLEQAGIPARAIHTAGSFENARLLERLGTPTLAIMQYDAALATYWGNPRLVYRPTDPAVTSWIAERGQVAPHVPSLRTLARLHPEWMHVIARSELLEGLEEGEAPTIRLLQGRRVCLGPRGSATQALAKAVLHHHGVAPASELHLPVRDMQTRLSPSEPEEEHDLDAGFFCGGRPSLALHELLREETGLFLLGMDPGRLVHLTLATSALEATTFARGEAGAYGCLTCDVPTIATRAVLVTTEDNPLVETITRVIYQGAGVLPGVGEEGQDVAGIEQSMAAPLASLLPHRDAVAVYEERGLRVAPDLRPIETLAGALGILAILVATYRGVGYLRQESLAERIHGQVLEVSLAATTLDSVAQLTRIRDAVRQRARRPWWMAGHLNKKRWHELEAMIDQRTDQARSTLCTALLAQARACRFGDDPDAQAARDELRRRIWQHAQDGELSELQVLLALRALGEEWRPGRP